MPSYSSDNQVLCDVLPHQVLREQTLQPAKLIFMLDLEVFEAWANERSWVPDDNVVDDTQNNMKTLNTGLTSCGLQASRMKCNIQPYKLFLFQTEVLFLAGHLEAGKIFHSSDKCWACLSWKVL